VTALDIFCILYMGAGLVGSVWVAVSNCRAFSQDLERNYK